MGVDDLIGDSDAPLVVTDRNAIRFIVLNRPAARNAMTWDMRREFAEAVAGGDADPAIRVMVVTGAGGVFTAGVDVKDLAARPGLPQFRPHPGEAARAAVKPFIAAVDGPCVTGGLELALSCSFIIASERSRFVDTHAKIGFFPGWGLSALLPRAIGIRRARQMSITGEFISVQQALAWGLVNEIVPADALVVRCVEIAAAIGRCDGVSANAQMALLKAADGLPFADAIAAEERAIEGWRISKKTGGPAE